MLDIDTKLVNSTLVWVYEFQINELKIGMVIISVFSNVINKNCIASNFIKNYFIIV